MRKFSFDLIAFPSFVVVHMSPVFYSLVASMPFYSLFFLSYPPFSRFCASIGWIRDDNGAKQSKQAIPAQPVSSKKAGKSFNPMILYFMCFGFGYHAIHFSTQEWHLSLQFCFDFLFLWNFNFMSHSPPFRTYRHTHTHLCDKGDILYQYHTYNFSS